MLEKIKEIYSLSVSIYYEIADDNMLASGHPGELGPAHNEVLTEEYSNLMGAIETLKQIANKMQKDNTYKK